MEKKVIVFTLVFFCILLRLSPKVYGIDDKAKPKKHILILSSYYAGYEWTDNIVKGINQEFKQQDKFVAQSYIEYLDVNIIKQKDYFKKLSQFYKYKFKNFSFDLVIVCDDAALQFMYTYRNSLFPNVPVVYCGINDTNKIKNNKFEYATGISEEIDYKKTIDLALELFPDTKNIYAIFDDSITGEANKEKAVSTVNSNYKNKQFEVINGSNIYQIIEELNNVHENSIVLLGSGFEDNNGNYLSITEGANLLSNGCELPIFSFWDFLIGKGAFGGFVIQSEDYGRETGKIAIDVIQGKNPSSIAKEQGKSGVYLLDYNLIRKFNLNGEKLKDNYILVNKHKVSYDMLVKAIKEGSIFIISILIILITLLLMNIKKRKTVEKALSNNIEILSTLINCSPDIICFKDYKCRWIQANDTLCEILQLDKHGYKGKTDLELAEIYINCKDEFISCDASDKKAMEKGELYREEEIFKSKDNSELIFDVIKVPAYHGNGKFKGIVVIGRDITEKKENEELEKKAEENRRLLMEAVEYDKLKTEFFANISHELRTPINVMLSTIQLIELYINRGLIKFDNEINKLSLQKKIHILKQNNYRLLRLVNNLIDITRIDSGFFELNLKNVNIVSTVEEISLSVTEYIEEKGITFIFDTEVEEKIIAVDEDKIERIMLNLLSNSIKYTEPGGEIKVNIYDKNNYISIVVSDTGIGIPEEKLNIIFERFRQVDKSLARKNEGSGIGLSLVKSLVNLHNGNIEVKSIYGKGTEFIINIPVKTIEEIEENNIMVKNVEDTHIERINIEFSDIYNW